ncbi:hypothetical protein GE061_005889 [Apolygus lucorum]|uniref:Uncharacterized protein n=1 Tax=Apolygus lucorum TaxID=248454 RepID=A0A8S9WWX7_APOLU|nr:hypothetical protein GE061_005889 [Apolygus lucorum]
MTKLFVNAKRSAILVTVLSVIGSCAQNVTNANNNETTVTSSGENATLTVLEELEQSGQESDDITSSVSQRNRTTLKPDKNSTTDDGARTEATVSIEPLPDGVEFPPAAMLLIAGITCGVTVGMFLICYIATMMNLCICKFLMHECPSGRYKDDENKNEKSSKKKKGKGDDAKEMPAEEPPPPGP